MGSRGIACLTIIAAVQRALDPSIVLAAIQRARDSSIIVAAVQRACGCSTIPATVQIHPVATANGHVVEGIPIVDLHDAVLCHTHIVCVCLSKSGTHQTPWCCRGRREEARG